MMVSSCRILLFGSLKKSVTLKVTIPKRIARKVLLVNIQIKKINSPGIMNGHPSRAIGKVIFIVVIYK